MTSTAIVDQKRENLGILRENGKIQHKIRGIYGES
jgi:hypothetical protein